jgi:alkylated DNA repair dioxygenase AlkB
MNTQLSFWDASDAENQLQGQLLSMPGAEVILYRNAFDSNERWRLFSELNDTTNWQQEFATLFNRSIALPRLTAWYGDRGKTYTYSNIRMEPQIWTPALLQVKSKVEAIVGVQFNSVLLNLYRNGKDSMGWHSDDERELGKNPVIASVSFGASRRFVFRQKFEKSLKFELELNSGSLLLMQGTTQHFWQHQVPKTRQTVPPRINLTFRRIS